MSADRYTTCPRCVSRYEIAVETLGEDLAAKYPELSLSALEALRPVLLAEHNLSEPEETFREDYEFAHGNNDRTVDVVYKGRCSVCGLEKIINQTHIIWDGVS